MEKTQIIAIYGQDDVYDYYLIIAIINGKPLELKRFKINPFIETVSLENAVRLAIAESGSNITDYEITLFAN